MKRILLATVIAGALSIGGTAASPALIRGPFIQSPSDTSVTIVWKTSPAATGQLRYGRTAGAWEFVRTATAAGAQEFVLTGLTPDTKYYYQAEADGSVIAYGPEYFFRTYPPVNSRRPFTFLAFGDSGTQDQQEYDVEANMEALRPRPELAIMLGDNVQPRGEDYLYDPAFFAPYRNIIRNTMIWPTMGNHDSYTDNGAPYLANFYLPTASGAAGKPSYTELYYSFDYGCAHFVCLDVVTSSRAVGGAMYNWLQADLDAAQARGARWKFVFFHYPPYSHGSHSSDTDWDLIQTRESFSPLMESRGVDIVFSGHSHSYERSYLVKNGAILQSSPNDYTKIGTSDGTMYIVSGCAGQIESGSLDHPLMAFSKGWINGNSILDVSYDECRGYFMLRDGTFTDLFSICKAVDTAAPYVRLVWSPSPTQIRVTFSEPVEAGAGTGGAANVSNYYIDEEAAVTGATLLSDGRTVVLATSALSVGVAYTLTISNVRDGAGNTVAGGTHAVSTLVLNGDDGSGGGDGDGDGGADGGGGATNYVEPTGTGRGCGLMGLEALLAMGVFLVIKKR